MPGHRENKVLSKGQCLPRSHGVKENCGDLNGQPTIPTKEGEVWVGAAEIRMGALSPGHFINQ